MATVSTELFINIPFDINYNLVTVELIYYYPVVLCGLKYKFIWFINKGDDALGCN